MTNAVKLQLSKGEEHDVTITETTERAVGSPLDEDHADDGKKTYIRAVPEDPMTNNSINDGVEKGQRLERNSSHSRSRRARRTSSSRLTSSQHRGSIRGSRSPKTRLSFISASAEGNTDGTHQDTKRKPRRSSENMMATSPRRSSAKSSSSHHHRSPNTTSPNRQRRQSARSSSFRTRRSGTHKGINKEETEQCLSRGLATEQQKTSSKGPEFGRSTTHDGCITYRPKWGTVRPIKEEESAATQEVGVPVDGEELKKHQQEATVALDRPKEEEPSASSALCQAAPTVEEPPVKFMLLDGSAQSHGSQGTQGSYGWYVTVSDDEEDDPFKFGNKDLQDTLQALLRAPEDKMGSAVDDNEEAEPEEAEEEEECYHVGEHHGESSKRKGSRDPTTPRSRGSPQRRCQKDNKDERPSAPQRSVSDRADERIGMRLLQGQPRTAATGRASSRHHQKRPSRKSVRSHDGAQKVSSHRRGASSGAGGYHHHCKTYQEKKSKRHSVGEHHKERRASVNCDILPDFEELLLKKNKDVLGVSAASCSSITVSTELLDDMSAIFDCKVDTAATTTTTTTRKKQEEYAVAATLAAASAAAEAVSAVSALLVQQQQQDEHDHHKDLIAALAASAASTAAALAAAASATGRHNNKNVLARSSSNETEELELELDPDDRCCCHCQRVRRRGINTTRSASSWRSRDHHRCVEENKQPTAA